MFLSSRDHAININEFTAICKALFRNDKGKPYKWGWQLQRVPAHSSCVPFKVFNESIKSLNDDKKYPGWTPSRSATCLWSSTSLGTGVWASRSLSTAGMAGLRRFVITAGWFWSETLIKYFITTETQSYSTTIDLFWQSCRGFFCTVVQLPW